MLQPRDRLLERDLRAQRPGEDVPQGREHADERRQQAGADRPSTVGGVTIRGRADRERERQVAGFGVEDLDRQELADQQPERAREHSDHERVEHQQPGRSSGALVSLAAHRLDQAAALGHGQQHRVEREEEADDGADADEQALGLFGRAERDREQRRVKVGRVEV